MAEKDKVVGKALYLELHSGEQRYQMLVTPDGVSSAGKNVPAVLYRRQVSRTAPRRAWKTTSFPTLTLNEFGTYALLSKELALESATSRVAYIGNIVERLNSYNYRIYKTPIFVEVSQADLDDVRAAKTPYKVLGRITRVRRALGFQDLLA
jgi:hypothetical protein